MQAKTFTLFDPRLLSLSLGLLFLFCCLSLSAQESTEAEIQREILVSNTHIAAQGLGGILLDLEQEKQVEYCRKFVKPIRFFSDKSGYFYIYDMKGSNIAHATQPEKEGKDLYEYQDSQGNYLIQALIKAAAEGGGFVEFWWENPLTQKEEQKLGYAEPIPGTDFFIGSGIYMK
jgi:signal transduction histidine kinase